MLARIVAALLIAVSALVYTGTHTASAEPRGRYRRYRRGRGHYRPHYENPLPGFLGGLLGGWLAEQLEPDEPKPPYFDGEEEDGPERDRR